jgi:hypothetical protein
VNPVLSGPLFGLGYCRHQSSVSSDGFVELTCVDLSVSKLALQVDIARFFLRFQLHYLNRFLDLAIQKVCTRLAE